MIEAFVFDLFHTLTPPERDASALPWTSDILGISRQAWHEALTTSSHERVTGALANPVEIVRLIAHGIDPAIPEETIVRAAAFRKERFKHVLMAIPPANLALLAELRRRGHRLGLISNCDAMEVEAWRESPLCGRFDAEVFSCQVGKAKPDPRIYLECLERLHVAPERSVFVGDGASRELSGARKAGMRTVLFSGVIADLWPERIPELLRDADGHVTSLEQLLESATPLA